jgi:hypothetical protein
MPHFIGKSGQNSRVQARTVWRGQRELDQLSSIWSGLDFAAAATCAGLPQLSITQRYKLDA